MTTIIRCPWTNEDPLYQAYHDDEWGRPIYDSQDLFAKLCLDGQQAGLSWYTILKKRDNYYQAYANFEPAKIVLFTEQDIERLMQDSGIVRNKLKVNSVIKNAKGFLALQQQGIDFSEFLWDFVDGKPVMNQYQTMAEVPTQTPASEAMSKALKKLGFTFVGPTICYAFMQAVGMVNDHLVSCHCYSKVVNK